MQQQVLKSKTKRNKRLKCTFAIKSSCASCWLWAYIIFGCASSRGFWLNPSICTGCWRNFAMWIMDTWASIIRWDMVSLLLFLAFLSECGPINTETITCKLSIPIHQINKKSLWLLFSTTNISCYKFSCWLSVYESVIWSLVGPCCVMIFCTLITFALGLRAAFTLKDHIEGYGNLRYTSIHRSLLFFYQINRLKSSWDIDFLIPTCNSICISFSSV